MSNPRHQAREWAVQFLYQSDFDPEQEYATAIDGFWAEIKSYRSELKEKIEFLSVEDTPEAKAAIKKLSKQLKGIKRTLVKEAFFTRLVEGVTAAKDSIDERLQGYAENWSIKRMGAVDRAILRLALYELFHCPDIPPVVSVNEAIELAKELSGEESGKFINGLLDRAIRDVDRPLRSAQPAPEGEG